jgi:hypothetical protein
VVVLRWAVLCLLAFAVTFAETTVSTWEGRADRQATSARDNRYSKKAATWAGVFEALLYLDIILVAKESTWLAVPVVVAAWIGKYVACESRRKKFRARVKRPKKRTLKED